MKTFGILIIGFLLVTAFPAFPASLWSFGIGAWLPGSEESRVISLDPFSFRAVAYPAKMNILGGAAYDISSSNLYLSGALKDIGSYLNMNSITIYNGNPDGYSFVSSSDVGLVNEYNWLGGLEYVNGSLYSIAFKGISTRGALALIKIDNPGSPSQSVVQIGPDLYTEDERCSSYALCKNGRGGLYAIVFCSQDQNYSMRFLDINYSTGEKTLLEEYSIDSSINCISGLALVDGRLIGCTEIGRIVEIDRDSFQITEIGNVGHQCYAMVAIPEPSSVLLCSLGASLIFFYRKRR